MDEEEKEEIKELINLLYNNHISQYGKRKLENYIKKLQKELDKSNKRIDMCIKLLNLEDCLKFDTKQEELDCIDRLVEIDKASYLEQIFPKNDQKKELDKKDKVIDKMAKTIAGLQLYDFGRKEYFTLEDEGEVKEYFYKKVEEENE